MREDAVRTREIVCPDCQGAILIVEQQGKLVGIPRLAGSEPGLNDPFSPPRNQLQLPSVIAGGVAAVLLIGLGIVVFLGNAAPIRKPIAAPEELSPAVPAKNPDSVQPPSAPVAPAPVAGGEKPDNSATSPQPVQAKEPQAEQLETVGKWIAESVGQNQVYPQETTGWSWLADFAEVHLGGRIARRKDLNWDHPTNDEFVRRSFKVLLNPALPETAGEDHYPATHYVGMTGAMFPATGDTPAEFQPGIFGSSKPVKAEDVRQGLSNTLLMAGVTTQHGSWARPGTATARGFTAEPFLSGPDGFGTGQADGQYVLMADGSTRFLSAKTDSKIVRQLASLQASEPKPVAVKPPVMNSPAANLPAVSSPPASQPAVPPTPKPELKASTADTPVAVPVFPDPPKIDLKKRLAQGIVRFEQPEPASLGDVLFDVQELLGFPIDLSALPDDVRQKKVKLKLEQTNVGDILRAIADDAGLGYSVHPDRIQIHVKN